MGKTFSISNFKGGTGKTSTALNLGAALAVSGKSVALIDCDSQGNLTAVMGYTPAEQPRTLANLLLATIDYPEDLDFHLQKTIIHTNTGIDLIPANRRLADAAARLQVMQLSQYNAVGDSGRASEKVMTELLDHLRSSYDYILIDCGLKHEFLTVNVLAASDHCIVPVQAHFGMLPVKETIKGEIVEKGRGRYHGKETNKGRNKIIVSAAASGRGN